MKKVWVGMLVASVLAVSANGFAGKIELGGWGDYSFVGMADFTRAVITANVTSIESWSGTVSTRANPTYGLGGGLDAYYIISPCLKAGARVGYLISTGALSGTFGGTQTFSVNEQLTIVPIMFGGNYSYPIIPGIILNGNVFLGYGLANWREVSVYNIGTVMTTIVDASGGGFCAEINVGGEFVILPFLSADVSVGYRFASVPQLISNVNIDLSGDGVADIKIGDVIKDGVFAMSTGGNPVVFDFSGITIHFGGKVKF